MIRDIISVDLGGTQIRSAHLNGKLEILERQATKTLAHEGLEPTLDRIKEMIRQVLPTRETAITGIGISAPGPLTPATGVVVAPPNLPGWHNVPLRDILENTFGLPVYVGNDANVAVLAEHLRGAARGKYRNIIYITQSTGIGSGIIVDGRLLLGHKGLAAEFGHIPIIMDGNRVSTVEREAAGPDMADHVRQRIENGESSMCADMVDNLDAIEGRTVGDAAKQGDKLALDVVRHAGRVMGLGIVTLLHLFNPEIIVIGGGVSMNLGDLIFDPMWEAIRETAHDNAYIDDIKIVPAELRDDVSIYGAAALAATKGGVIDTTEVAELLGQ